MTPQLELPLLCRLTGPSVVPDAYIKECNTYRDAVRLCWHLRRRKAMTKRVLAEEVGFHAPHATEFLSEGIECRELPAKYIRQFEYVCSNSAISQWIARGSQLTILEEMQLRAA